MNPYYAKVAERAGHRCEYCHAPEAIFNFPFEVEHIVAASKGGTDDLANRGLACRSCNLFKSDHLTGVDPETGQEANIFNPRIENWEVHFHIDAERGSIVGMTLVGRVTVARLQMNSRLQQAARGAWMSLGLFP